MNENVEIGELTMDQLSEVSAGGPMNGTGGGGATGTGPGTGGGDGLGHLRALGGAIIGAVESAVSPLLHIF
jgi:hypothetical protein